MVVTIAVVVLIAALAALVFGLAALVRAGRAKGYRGPFLLIGLVVLTFLVVLGAQAVLSSFLDDEGFSHGLLGGVLVSLLVPMLLSMALNGVVVWALPRRPARVAGVRRTRFPYSAAAAVLWVGAVASVGVMFAIGRGDEAVQYFVPLGLLAGMCTALDARSRTQQAARSAELDVDGSTVLLLRGFRDERLTFSYSDARRSRRGARRWIGALFPDARADALTAERYLGPAISDRIGPLVGLGNPVDYLPPEGMLRLYAPDDEWQREVRRLVQQVRAIVVLAGTSTLSLS